MSALQTNMDKSRFRHKKEKPSLNECGSEKKIFLFATSFLVLVSSLPQYSPPFACQPGSFPLPLDPPAKEEEETAKQVQEGRRAPREKEVEVKGSIISSFFPPLFSFLRP